MPALLRECVRALSVLNMLGGLSDPIAEARAVELLHALHVDGARLNPDDVRLLALEDGWQSDEADKLAVLVQLVRTGQRAAPWNDQSWGVPMLAVIKSELMTRTKP
jgi:hypothetical protein